MEEEKSRAVFLAFEALNLGLDVPKVSMWSLSDRYAYPPYFKFRFKNLPVDSKIYESIKTQIESFKGELDWAVISPKNSKNYIVVPEIFSKYIQEQTPFSKEFFSSIMDMESYEKYIDKAINDVPKLSLAIRQLTFK